MRDQEPGGLRRWSRSAVLTVAIVTAVATAAIAALLVNIIERKQEAQQTFFRVVELTDETIDPAVWGKNFPLQYDAYLRTVDQQRTRYGGSEAMPQTPTEADPRSTVSESRLEEDRRLKTMWAGYAFATDFRKKRGHAYMLEDQTFTERVQNFKQPGTCIHCHASVYVPYKKAGDGDLIKGFEHYNQMPYAEARKDFTHPIACIDCHEPDTMALRVTRPGFIEGIRAYKAGQGVKDYDVNTMATRQEMRTFVCGQCHVEYYFKGPEKRLTYPWAKGLRGRPDLRLLPRGGLHRLDPRRDRRARAQGPAPRVRDVEPGHPRALRRRLRRLPHALHARGRAEDQRPPRAEPAAEHQPRLPDVSQVVGGGAAGAGGDSQQRTVDLRNRAMDALMALIADIKAAKQAGVPDAQLAAAREFQRHGQFYLDFVESENSNGFHAPQEALRILGEAIDYLRQGQLALRPAVARAEK